MPTKHQGELMAGVMQSGFSLSKDAAAIWRSYAEAEGLSVHSIVLPKANTGLSLNEVNCEGIWDVFFADAPQIKVMVDVRLIKNMPVDMVHIDVHWCSDVGLPSRDASRKIALRLQAILRKLGATSENEQITD
jgi:hypothetical protein